MRQIVIGLAAAAALVFAGPAQASRPGERPNDYGFGAGSVRAASNPYGNIEKGGMARGFARVQHATHFGASRPSENGVRDSVGRQMKSMARRGGVGAVSGAVRGGLNPYHYVEAGALARSAAMRQAKNGGQGPSMPASDSVGRDVASRNLKAMSGGGHGVPNSVRMGLNPYYFVEAGAVVRGQARALQKTNQHASMPAEHDGTRADRASANLKAMSGRSGGGVANSVRMGLNPYYYVEAGALARAQARARQKTNQGASQPADGDGTRADFAAKQMKAFAGQHVERHGVLFPNLSIDRHHAAAPAATRAAAAKAGPSRNELP